MHSQSPRPTRSALIASNLLILTRPKIFSASIQLSLREHRRRAQNPIALLPHHSPAALLVHYLPTRFRALALFGRRPTVRVMRSVLPASENLHKTRMAFDRPYVSFGELRTRVRRSVRGQGRAAAVAAHKPPGEAGLRPSPCRKGYATTPHKLQGPTISQSSIDNSPGGFLLR